MQIRLLKTQKKKKDLDSKQLCKRDKEMGKASDFEMTKVKCALPFFRL